MLPESSLQNAATDYRVLEDGLIKFHQGGVRVLLSGDTGLLSQYFGVAEHREMEAMARAGMPAIDVLTAATSRPAEMLGLADRGSLHAGKRSGTANYVTMSYRNDNLDEPEE
jgi:imidazolonepropionase-like amidohydrolase